ncbi:MAG TPA: type IV pilin-like G/H family protein [Kamptonema sp.]|nr:type IV pilin-like G/H family protein [Kamptonema sp.]
MENQSLLNGKVMQPQPESETVAPKKKGILWYLVKGGILFLILNLGIEGFRYFFTDSNYSKYSMCRNGLPYPEARQYVGSMYRAQQAKFAENGRFANSIDELKLGIKTQTTTFKYSVSATKTAAFSYGIPYKDSHYSKTVYFGLFYWDEKIEPRGYVSAVFIVPATNVDTKATKNEMTTVGIMCVAKFPSKTQPANPILEKGVPTCANGTDLVTK